MNVAQENPTLAQAIAYALRGEASPMLDTAEALLLGGSDNLPVSD